MTTQHLLIAALLTIAYALYARDSAVVALDGSFGWVLTSKFINALALAIIYLLAFGLVTVLA